MELLQQYAEKTIGSSALWITNCVKQVVDLKIKGVQEFGRHPIYPNTMKGSLIIEGWVMEDSDGPDTKGWPDRLKVLVHNYLNESVQAYQILYHEFFPMQDGNFLMTFNCKVY